MTDKDQPERPATPGMAEISAKFEHETKAATPEVTGADALLEKLAADFHAACKAGDRAQDALDAARQPDAPVSPAESGERAILDRMLGIEAGGLRGVRAKVQAMMPPFAWQRFGGSDTSEFDPLIDHDMLRSVVVDLERLVGGNATTDSAPAAPTDNDPLLAVITDLEAVKKACSNTLQGAAYDALSERAQALDQKMFETRARSLVGVVWKLRELTRYLYAWDTSEFESNLIRSILADVETLGGEA